MALKISADPPELRPSGSCAARKANNLNTSFSEDESEGLDNKKKENKSNNNKLPEKIVIERPRVMARLKYADWNENPMAIRNLLLFLEKDLDLPAIEIKSRHDQEVKLSHEQKLSVFDQLKDFHINLGEKAGFIINQPILHGDIPPADGDGDPVAVFDVLNESTQITAESFSILFMTGLKNFDVDDKLVSKLRTYVLRGGFILADSASSSKEFTQSFIKLAARMFPKAELKPLPLTHRVFSTVYDLKSLRFTGRDKSGKFPVLYGLQIDGRVAVFLSDSAISCGWDGHMHGEYVEKELHYEDALKLGANIIAYTLGFRSYGRDLPPFPGQPSEKESPEDLTLPYAASESDAYVFWPAIANLLTFAEKNINASVRIEKRSYSLEDKELYKTPLIYLPVTKNMVFSESVREEFKKFFSRGGTLIAEAVYSDKEADRAFREFVKSLYPKKKMRPLDSSHGLFKSFFKLDKIFWRQQSFSSLKDRKIEGFDEAKRAGPPYIESLEENGIMKIVYSPYDMIHGFRGHPFLGISGVSHIGDSALKLGINILVFILNGG